jgi:hypothetical protein
MQSQSRGDADIHDPADTTIVRGSLRRLLELVGKAIAVRLKEASDKSLRNSADDSRRASSRDDEPTP